MKNVRYVLMDTACYDYHQLEQNLTRRAADGWHLEKIGNILWKFRRGQPKDVRYEIIFSPAASAYNSRPTEAEEELAELCAQAGWVRVGALAQIQVFRNDDPNATPLETDEAAKYQNIRRTMLRHFIPQQLLLVVLFALQFMMHGSTALKYPTRILSSGLTVCTLGMLLVVTFSYFVMFLANLLWLRRARRSVESGCPIPPNGFYRIYRWAIWVILAIYLAALMWTVEPAFCAMTLILSAAFLTSIFLTMKVCKFMNAPPWVNFAAPIIVTCIVVSLTTQITVNYLNDRLPQVHRQAIPLTLQQLTEEADSQTQMLENIGSPLASYRRCQDEGESCRISYAIADIHCPWFYDMIQKDQEESFMQASTYRGIDSRNLASLWGAEYARRSSNSTSDLWLICWDSRIVLLRASWPMTDAQIALAAEILKP